MSKHSYNFLFLPQLANSTKKILEQYTKMASKWRLGRFLFIKDKFVSFTTGYRGDFWEGYFLSWWDGLLIGSAGKFKLENAMLCWVIFSPQTKITLEKTRLNHVFGTRWVTIDVAFIIRLWCFLCFIVWAVNFWAFCFGSLSVVTAWCRSMWKTFKTAHTVACKPIKRVTVT